MTRQRFCKQPGAPLPMRSRAPLGTTVACVALVLLLLLLLLQLLRKKNLSKAVSGGPIQRSDNTQFYYGALKKKPANDI